MIPTINAAQFAAALDKIEISHRGAGRRLFGIGERHVRRLIAGAPISPTMAIALALMIKHGHKAAEIGAIVREVFPPQPKSKKATP